MRALRWPALWWAGGAGLVLLVTWLSLRSGGVVVPLPDTRYADKFAHALAYMTLALWFSGLLRREHYGTLGAVLILVGATLEVLQGIMPHRQTELLDGVANTLGVGLGLIAAAWGLGAWCQWIENRLP